RTSVRGMTGQTTSDAIAGDLEDQILDGRLATGQRLPPERQLAERYGVSRPIVREALRSLAERRLVRVAAGRGTFVSPGALDGSRSLDLLYRRRQTTARQLTEARVMLECQAAALAAARADAGDRHVLRVALERLDEALSAWSGPIEIARRDLAFHLAIARAAHNPVIETMFASIAGMTVELMLRSLAEPDIARASHPYHHQVLVAIERCDPTDAAAALRAHLKVGEDTYGPDYDRSLDVLAHRELQRILGPDAGLDELLEAVVAPVAQG
ncbi:MAG: FadR/GntR family transcriptional regulator, partial [Egibacteraceae bacterium]